MILHGRVFLGRSETHRSTRPRKKKKPSTVQHNDSTKYNMVNKPVTEGNTNTSLWEKLFTRTKDNSNAAVTEKPTLTWVKTQKSCLYSLWTAYRQLAPVFCLLRVSSLCSSLLLFMILKKGPQKSFKFIVSQMFDLIYPAEFSEPFSHCLKGCFNSQRKMSFNIVKKIN